MTETLESQSNNEIDWTGIEPSMAKQILDLGGRFLESQLASAIAADQRAVTSASIFVGFSAALMAATIAVWTDGHGNIGLLVGGLLVAGLLMTAAFFCWHASRPVDFYFPGAHPNMWWGARHENLAEVIGGQSEHYQDAIDENARILQSNADWLSRGMRLAIASPLIGLIVWSGLSWFLGEFSPA